MGAISLVLLQLIVIRVMGLTPGGVFAFALTLGQQFQMLGAFEVRPYQATDVRGRFTFGTYHAARIVTTALMIAGLIGYAALSSRPPHEAFLLLLVGFLRAFDAFEDVFYGEFQRLGRLDLAGRAFFLRTLVTTVTFSFVLLATRDLTMTCIATIAISLVAMVAFIVPPARSMFGLRPQFAVGPVRELLWACLPLFGASFLAMYLANAPRFGIEQYLSDDVQAYYAILFVPALAINVLSLFVFRPLLTRMATLWAEGDRDGFLTVIGRGTIGALAAFVVTFAVAWAIGLPLLGLLYGADLGAYQSELLILVTGGALNAIGVILYYALVTLRRRRIILVGYLVAAALVTGLSWLLIPPLGMIGACLAYGGSMLALALLFGAPMMVVARTSAERVEPSTNAVSSAVDGLSPDDEADTREPQE